MFAEDAPKKPIRARDASCFLDLMERTISMRTDSIDRFVIDLQAVERAIGESSGSGKLRSLETALMNPLAPDMKVTGNAFIRKP